MAKRAIKAKQHYNQAAFYVITGAAVALGTYFLLNALASDKVAADLVPPGRSRYYKTGEQISFGITNNGKTSIKMAAGAAWRVGGADNVHVFTSIDNSASEVPSGESIYWSWDQTNRAGKQVEVGKYEIEISYIDSGESETKVIPVSIVDGETPWYKKFFD